MIVWDKKKKIILGVIIGLAVVGIALGVWAFVRDKNEGTNKLPVEFANTKVTCELDGTEVSADVASKHPLAVMIENHPEARPQAGLTEASIIYEAVTEGGITRFMALYSCYTTDKIGPVRSARTMFVDWEEEYDAFYAHAGGAQNALTKIVEDGVLDLNHNGTAFWRQNDGRALEHTLYTSVPNLYQYAQDKGYDINSSDYTQFEFKSNPPLDERPNPGKGAIIDFSGNATYEVEWTYNRDNNTYLRTMAGTAHTDEITGKQVEASNIVIPIYTRNAVDSGGKTVYNFDTIGSGKAQILQDGVVIEGTWKKENSGDRTLYYDSGGNEVKFNPGQTWIEVVNPDISTVTITN